MFAKKERLNRTEFSRHFNLGKRRHGVYLTVIVSPAHTFFCSVVVSKKVAKKAHDRNRIKRRLYALMVIDRQKVNLTGAYILLAKPSLVKLTKSDFNEQISVEIGRLINNR